MPASPDRRREPSPDSDDTMDVQFDDLPPSSSRTPQFAAESRKRRTYAFSDIEMAATEHSPKRARLGTRNSAIEGSTTTAGLAEESLLLLQQSIGVGVGGTAGASLSSLSSSSLMSPPSSSIPLDARPSSDSNLPPSLSSRAQSFPMSRSSSSVKMGSRTGSRSSSEAGTPGPGAKSTPSHFFWFEDGDVILSVQETYFRVHGSKLSDCSTMFKVLRENGWRLPGVDIGPDKLDGRPVVRLESDAPKDWIVVLEAIYEAPTFYLRPVVFDSLGSLLRISTKYDMCVIRGWVVAQLRTTWPDPAHLHQMGPMAIPRAAEAIAWGRAYNVPCILPAAFYALSVQRWRSGADGGRAHTVLTPMDMRALIQGRESLQDVLVEWMADPLVVQPPPAPPTRNLGKPFMLRDHTNHHPSNTTPRLDSIDSIKAVSQMQVTVVQEPPKPPEIPRFAFHHQSASEGPGCGPRLAKLWRRRLRPDARRPWGTWLLRELHRMASLPMGVASCRASTEPSAVSKGTGHALKGEKSAGVVAEDSSLSSSSLGSSSNNTKFDARLSIIPDALLPIGRSTPGAVAAVLSSATRPPTADQKDGPGDAEMIMEGEAQSLGFGSEDLEAEDGRLVCARCWEEHRRLVLWRMNWLKDEIPGMFGL
ncbi:hypothetical protein SCHPADRAFT_209032 [Schizopora paradoxa]|uniref:BTB domain-containing protein n=1 Tax=Schizopora paradoxa TaxID=27342 RepID=A0A0H2RWT8_9AGAM|nr:hypothetical protein SCHPADRAFT_209032 [Schizopora paradoxa]